MIRAWHDFVRFVTELTRTQHRDQLLVRAAALAYTTLLSLVPLLTVGIATVGRVQPEQAALLIQAIAAMLPFSPERVQDALGTFAQRTAALGWIAVAVSVLLTFNAFYQIEEVINDIWGVPRRRLWRWRLASFAMVLLSGPLLLTTLFSGLYWLSSRPWYHVIAPVARPLPAVLAAVVLACLYRAVPHTRVSWRAAVIGAVVAAVALTALHLGFQAYILFAANLNVIYGSLTVLLFFLVGLFLFWLAVLLGAEASWVIAHRDGVPAVKGLGAVLELLLSLDREGHLSTDSIVRALGHGGDDILVTLAAPPAIVAAEPSGWRLARAAEEITLGEVRARATDGTPAGEIGEPDTITLAELARRLVGSRPGAAPDEDDGRLADRA